MRKVIMALLVTGASMCASAQTRPVSADLAKQKPLVSVELLRASTACGPLLDCSYHESSWRSTGIRTDPCVSTPFGCQLSSTSSEWKSSGYFGGAKLSTEIGNWSLTFGRHRDNLVLTQATFAEGAFRLGEGSLVVGLLRGPHIADSAHSVGLLGYVAYRMSF